MKIVIAGGTGFIGEALARELLRVGEVVVLSRDPAKVREGRGVAWSAAPGGAWEGEIAEADAVVNLAGENIGAGRWTPERKKRLLDSRVNATGALAEAISARPRDGRVFVSASAIGIYGDRGDEVLDESAPPGTGVLSEISRRWEAASRAASGARLVNPRLGIVLGRDGGALPKMALPVRFFAGGKVGSGRQWMSWVDLRDVIRLVVWAIETKTAEGAYNVVAPNPVTNAEFVATLGTVLHRPTAIPTPAAALRLALGEAADELLLASQRVVPRRAEAQGFRFEVRDLAASLRSIYGV
ncbi:MAG TPA: TIGR01777 family oxidoreductase [Thermoanaerobaculia bacterium]